MNQFNLKTRLFNIWQQMRGSVVRIPVSLACAAGLSLLMFVQNHGMADIPQFPKLFYILASGIVWSAAVVVTLEERVRRRTANLIAAAIAVAWSAAVWFGLPADISVSQIYVHTALMLCAVIALFAGAFAGRKGDSENAFWNFSAGVAWSAVVAGVFGSILSGGAIGALGMVEALFDVDISSKIYADICNLTLFLIPTVFWLSQIPAGGEKFRATLFAPKVLRILCFYILCPIFIVYFVILHFYAAKILLSGTLPQGGVTYMVAAAYVLFLATLGLAYPFCVQRTNRAAEWLARYGAWLTLVPVVLMSFAIARRIGDYQLTANRVYVILLNLWFYAVSAFLIRRRMPRLRWIAVSFAAVFLLFSFGPWSAFGIAKRSALGELRSLDIDLRAFCTDSTFESRRLIDSMEARKMTPEEMKRVGSLASYLARNYPDRDRAEIFGNLRAANKAEYSYTIIDYAEQQIDTLSSLCAYRKSEPFQLHIDDYDTFYSGDSCRAYGDTLYIFAPERDSVAVPMRFFWKLDHNQPAEGFAVNGDDYKIIFNEINIYQSNISVEYIMFYIKDKLNLK